jgi:hypothetical protein
MVVVRLLLFSLALVDQRRLFFSVLATAAAVFAFPFRRFFFLAFFASVFFLVVEILSALVVGMVVLFWFFQLVSIEK